jgi:1,4-dihydroxy-2-naphthoate octaprenyltransferase
MNQPGNRWIIGARTKTLPAAIAPVLVAVAIAYPEFNLINALLALTVGLALQIAVNYANDYSDGVKGTDEERIGPTRLVASGLASAAEVKQAAFVAFGIGAIAGLYLATRTSLWFIAIGLAAIISAWRYTGGKNPYGYRGQGEIYVFIFFGLVATLGTFYSQTGQITIEAIMVAISNGAVACALLAVNNIRDIEGDRKAGKETMAVRLGDLRARRFFMFLIFIAIFTAFSVTILAVLGIFPAMKLLNEIKFRKGKELIEVLGKTGKFQLTLCALISIGTLVNI